MKNDTDARWRKVAPTVAAAKIGRLPIGSSKANSVTKRLTPNSLAFIASLTEIWHVATIATLPSPYRAIRARPQPAE
ncbi:hypothetical protein GCM10009093_05960 [Brevundimonas terrae]|uniref:Uncharacterized protein n=1 Tax=Brevundimonas terrae TaxID=363631 RepID=A0ABN0Y3E9_9CAUL